LLICFLLYLYVLNNKNIQFDNELNLNENENENENSNLVINKNTYDINNDINNGIPKIIIQTWKSNTVPQRYMKLINSVKENNPDYKYLFFTDDDIEKFFKMYYPDYFVTFLRLPKIIQRIDFFRYVAVYHFGGIYLDLDMKVFKSFDEILNNSCVFPIDEYINISFCRTNRYKPYCDKGQTFLLGQYAFAAEPKHPFIKLLIDKIHGSIDYYIQYADYNSEDYIYKTTGPDFVTDVYIDYQNKNAITILDNGKRQYFGNYAKHNYFGTWK
jgi:mannosyltransferase OCH1-like enzyme